MATDSLNPDPVGLTGRSERCDQNSIDVQTQSRSGGRCPSPSRFCGGENERHETPIQSHPVYSSRSPTRSGYNGVQYQPVPFLPARFVGQRASLVLEWASGDEYERRFPTRKRRIVSEAARSKPWGDRVHPWVVTVVEAELRCDRVLRLQSCDWVSACLRQRSARGSNPTPETAPTIGSASHHA